MSSRRHPSRIFTLWLALLALAATTAAAQPAEPETGDDSKIFLRGRVLDTAAPPEPLPQLFSRGPTAGDQLILIQFEGPIQDEWLETVKELGKVEIVTYLPSYAYLIWTDGPTLRRLGELSREAGSALRWVGPYQPAYSVHPELATAAAAAVAEERKVTVQFVDHDRVEASIAAVEARATEVLQEAWRVGPYRNLRVVVSAADLAEIAALPDVVNIEPFIEPTLFGERQGQILAGRLNAAGSQPTAPGYLAWLNARGFNATFDFTVDVTDGGLDRGQTAAANVHRDFRDAAGASRVTYVQRVKGTNISTTAADNRDSGGHGTIDAAIVGGFNNTPDTPGGGTDFEDAAGYQHGLGIAPFVRLGSSRIFAPGWTNPNFTALIDSAYRRGARISNNSWGASCGGGCCSAGTLGAYNATSQEYDRLVRDARPVAAPGGGQAGNQEMVIVFAAGNLGGCPNEDLGNDGSTAKNTLVVGASESFNQAGTYGCGGANAANDARDVAGFSSRGPAQDRRVKPDLMAPGTRILGAASQDGSFNGSGVCDKYFPAGQTLYTWSSGTSHAAPAVAGGAALLRQWFLNRGRPSPSPAMTKAYLMSAATRMTGTGANDDLPSNNQGMGRMNLGRAFDAVRRMLVDQSHTFGGSGQTFTLRGTIPDGTQPFRVALAWTDAPGSATAANAWVNDLDLEVRVVHGTTSRLFRGNVFQGDRSQTGGAADRRNNVESVWLPAGTRGDFTVTVRARNVAGDGVPNNADATDQDFALVVYNGERDRPGVDVDLVLDISGSMLDKACPQPGCESRLEVLKDAVEIFVQLWTTLAVPQDRLGVTYFRTRVEELKIGGNALLPVAANASNIIADVRKQKTDPYKLTAMGAGLQVAIDRLSDPGRRRSVILFTDGEQNVNPMVQRIGTTPFHLDIKNEAGRPSSGVSPKSPPMRLAPALKRRVNTIGVGAGAPFVDLLTKIASKTQGVTKTTVAPDDDLRRFYVEELVAVLRGFSPQLVGYRKGRLKGSGGSETFRVNRTARQVVFKLSWRRGEEMSFTVDKDGVDVTDAGEVIDGGFYSIFTLDLPATVHGQPITAEGDWTLTIDGQGSADAAYEAAAIAEESRLGYDFSLGERVYTAGEPLKLGARLTVDGQPLTDARVKATVFGPRVSTGTLLSETPTPSFGPLKAEPAATGGQKKLQALIARPDFWQKLQLQPVTPRVTLRHDGGSSYSASYPDTEVPGAYRVVFEVSGQHPALGEYRRTETLSALVAFAAADFSASEVTLEHNDGVILILRPRDLDGNYLGPDYGHRIRVAVDGEATGTPRDLLDGRYAFRLPAAGSDPHLEITVMERPFYDGPLSEIGGRERFAVSWHFGLTEPRGDFDAAVDGGHLFELDLEVPVSRRLSLNGVLGHYRFDPGTDILGGTLYLRATSRPLGDFRLFAEAGPGLYDPDNLDLAFGLSAGVGADRVLSPRWRGEIGAYFFHLWNDGPDIEFLTFKLGLRRSF